MREERTLSLEGKSKPWIFSSLEAFEAKIAGARQTGGVGVERMLHELIRAYFCVYFFGCL